jgi:NADPH2:quinone reductase
MLAVEVTRFGGPEVLVPRQVADPVPGAGQVLVEAHAVDVLFVEGQVRSGWGRGYFDARPPYVPGDGLAGVVVAAGDGVDAGWLGRRVVGYTGNANGYAELAVVDANLLVEIPDGVPLTDAATLSHDGPMAVTLVDAAAIRPGERVLVLGANGGAGQLVVTLAARAGAHVTAAARGDAKQALARDAGAHQTVDPTTTGWLDAVIGAGGADVVFDGVGGRLGTDAVAAVTEHGRFFAYGAPTGDFATVDQAAADRRHLTVYSLPLLARARDEITTLTARALKEAATGALRPVVGATFPIARAAEAHAALESRAVLGKVLLARGSSQKSAP